MEETNKKIVEENVLIARRVPPSDRWRLVANEPDGPIHKSLTDTLEAYMVKTGFKGNYRLEPLQSKLYAIQTDEIEVKPEPVKKFSLYGEFGEHH
mgnify:FL=1|tara:strand:+ start:439 stop:723 length:285 start_codon:yes stop_codon:yes gene_type:complete